MNYDADSAVNFGVHLGAERGVNLGVDLGVKSIVILGLGPGGTIRNIGSSRSRSARHAPRSMHRETAVEAHSVALRSRATLPEHPTMPRWRVNC